MIHTTSHPTDYILAPPTTYPCAISIYHLDQILNISNVEILHHRVSQHNHCCVMSKKTILTVLPPKSCVCVAIPFCPERLAREPASKATQEEGRARALSLRGRFLARRSSSLISVHERYK